MNSLQKLMMLVIGLVFITSCDNGKTSQSVFKNQTSSCYSSSLPNRYMALWEDGRFTVETTPEGTTDEDFRENFVDKNLALLKYVDRDYKIKIEKMSESDDVEQSAASLSWGPEKIEANRVWQQGFTGQNVKVGVVDGMVDPTHEQLFANVISAEQFNAGSNDPALNKHGTHVAGIIAADPSKGPVQGVAPAAKIISGQFIGNDGSGNLSDAIIAMNSVADKGAKVINMSWGGAPYVQTLQSAMQSLSDRGVLIVTTAGNDEINTDVCPNYPAAFKLPGQINVAASTISDQLIYFSNFGDLTVNVVAPGVDILSTIPGNKYVSMNGTSMAAPMVTGSAALLWSAFPAATSQQVKQAIYASVDKNIYFPVSTHGRINVRKALDALRSMLPSQ